MKNKKLNEAALAAYYECLFRVREHETLSNMFIQSNKHKGCENLEFLENW